MGVVKIIEYAAGGKGEVTAHQEEYPHLYKIYVDGKEYVPKPQVAQLDADRLHLALYTYKKANKGGTPNMAQMKAMTGIDDPDEIREILKRLSDNGRIVMTAEGIQLKGEYWGLRQC